MTNTRSGGHASNSDTDASKSISPAARKFAEYLARRMGPMIEHAARRSEQEPASVDAERQDVSKPTKH
jgi:hypothetical protein